MTHRIHCVFAIILTVLIAWTFYALAETPQWIQSEERLVGENSTQYEDTLNRPIKTIWNMFLVGHDVDGNPTFSPADIGAVSQTTFDNFTGHTHTPAEIGAAAISHTHSEYTLQTTFDSHTHSLTSLGAASQTDHDSLQSSFDAHSHTPLDIGAVSDSTFLVEHNIDGTHSISTGSGVTFWGLQSISHATTLLSATQDTYADFEAAELQISVLAEVDDLNTAEVFIEIETAYNGYTCPKIRFGKNAANQLYVEHCTDVETAASTIYISTTAITAQQQGRRVEYAVKIDEGTGITFYMDGLVETVAISTTMDKSGTGTDTLRLYKGFKGIAGPVKVGNKAVWPDGWKGVSVAGETFPWGVFALPLSEGEGVSVTDAIGGLSLSASGTWIEIPGPY